MSYKRIFSLFVVVLGLSLSANAVFAQEPVASPVSAEAATAPAEKKGINITELVFGHVSDSHEWHWFSLKNADGTERPFASPLPMIIYQPGIGFSFFSSN